MKSFLLLSALSVFAGCSVDNENKNTPDSKMVSFEDSWSEWKKIKGENSIYSYEIRSYDEINGFENLRAKRSIIDFDIEKNQVICRGYLEVVTQPGENLQTVESWTEIDDINSHSSGFPAQPLDSIYEQCRRILDADLKNTNLRFFENSKLLMQCQNTKNKNNQVDIFVEKISIGEQRCQAGIDGSIRPVWWH